MIGRRVLLPGVRVAGAVLWCAVLAWAPHGCVVDDGGEGRSARTSRTVVRAEQNRASGAPVSIDGPIARPATEARTINARVIAGVQPLGSVPFDGQVLPLVSPDGRRVATQVGEWPGWEAYLGERGAGPALRTRIEVWDISSSPASRANLRVPLRGVMLGRSCDAEGFLVEENMADGSRRIGKANWETGEVRWLVQDGRVNAFGQLLEGGGVAWSARDVEGGAFDLVINGAVAARGGDASYLFPMVSGERDVLYVLAASDSAGGGAGAGLELQARSLARGKDSGTVVVARRKLCPNAAPIVAYQASSPANGAVGLGATAYSSGRVPGLLLYHPGTGRMAVFDPGRGQMLLLADHSISGAWAHDEGGWAALVTTPQGLEHQRVVIRDGLWEVLPTARSLGDAYVARATTDAARPFVLIGPDPGDARRVRVMGMELLPE